MIRNDLKLGSAHGLMLVSSGKGLAFQRRVAANGVSTTTPGPLLAAPRWVKIARANAITAFRVPGGGLPPRPALHPGPHHTRRPDDFGNRRQDRRRPPRRQEPRRRVPQPAAHRHRRRAPRGHSPSARCGPPWARPSRWRRSATSGCSSCSRRTAGAGTGRACGPHLGRPRRARRARRAGPRSTSSLADERERNTGGGRITLNLGHTLGHAVEAAAGFGGLLHGEAVAYGLRAAIMDRHRDGRDAIRPRRTHRQPARSPSTSRPSRSPTR